MIKIDATNQPLGRLASKVANFLRGKHRPDFQSHLLSKEKVIVYNTDKIKLTGKKLEQKKYYHHSGYPGGLKIIKLKELFKNNSREVLRRAVFGMLPKNKSRKKIIKNLKLFKGNYND